MSGTDKLETSTLVCGSPVRDFKFGVRIDRQAYKPKKMQK